MNIKNNFLATGIGSLSFTDVAKSVEFILSNFKNHIPFWPQLPRMSFLESMHVQYSEGFPGRVVDLSKKNIYIDTHKNSFMDEFEKCYDAINNKNVSYFAIGKDYACGLYEFTDKIKGLNFNFVKGQVIGPISYGMTLLDERKRPIIFNKELAEIIPQFLSLKAKWQIGHIKAATKSNIIVFIDEPYLVAIGTDQFAGLDKAGIVSQLNTVIDVIHKEGASAGIHCCGNTDWSLVLESNIDILSFDAFGFMDNLLIYKDSLDKFIKRGGVIAFGIVPNREDFNPQGYKEQSSKLLHSDKIKFLLQNGALITPSCGCGTVSEFFARQVHIVSIAIAKLLQSQRR